MNKTAQRRIIKDSLFQSSIMEEKNDEGKYGVIDKLIGAYEKNYDTLYYTLYNRGNYRYKAALFFRNIFQSHKNLHYYNNMKIFW